ncbi:hypothetical protein Thini_2573 [Thiothrix nivea DSM 5205]|uniref:Uncharacterized protein n=1 Tax=Thiothrix nivea (strain ATCC 35100 / DSM 5205 / JP2) TaxID=870187 RepID=A0A656HFG8_THINJ|nr:hypothetical protein Thini_2573 [Thiothrix nivea DSM 5205]
MEMTFYTLTGIRQEFYNNATRKLRKPMSYAAARAKIKRHEVWEVIRVEPALIHSASEIQEAHGLSFWDSLIAESGARRNSDLPRISVVG